MLVISVNITLFQPYYNLFFVLSFSACTTLLVGSSARSTGYGTYGYGGKNPPAVAANGSGGRYRSSSGYSGGTSEVSKATDQSKGMVFLFYFLLSLPL